MTADEALAVAVLVVEAYPREVREGTIEAYAQHLSDLDCAATVQAVRRLIATSKWLPSIAEIRGAIVAADHRFPSAPEAWQQAERLMAKRGSYRPMARGSGDPVHRALELCGRWEDVCKEDVAWLRKRYVEIYDGLVTEARHGIAAGEPPDWLELDGPRVPLALLEGGRRG